MGPEHQGDRSHGVGEPTGGASWGKEGQELPSQQQRQMIRREVQDGQSAVMSWLSSPGNTRDRAERRPWPQLGAPVVTGWDLRRRRTARKGVWEEEVREVEKKARGVPWKPRGGGVLRRDPPKCQTARDRPLDFTFSAAFTSVCLVTFYASEYNIYL